MVAGNGYHWGSDWAEKLQDVPIPPVPTFDEAMSSVEERARRLVGKVRCGRKFEPAHPFVAKEKPLVEWYRKSAQATNTNDVIIRFERKNGGERSTAGYFDLKDVPLLKHIWTTAFRPSCRAISAATLILHRIGDRLTPKTKHVTWPSASK